VVLAVTVGALVSLIVPATAYWKLAEVESILRDEGANLTTGAEAAAVTGTPLANVTVILVAESITADVLVTPLCVTEPVKPEVGKPVPATSRTVALFRVKPVIVGEEAESCSNSQSVAV
jgi:hypothetical protein